MFHKFRKHNNGFTPDEESFYLTVTSDNNSEIFPDNKVSDFQVRLANPIFLDHNSWKVGLAAFQYPYEFANITDKSWVTFYCHGNIKTIKFPPWFFETIEDLCAFISQIVTHHLKQIIKQNEEKSSYHTVVYDTNPSEWLEQRENFMKFNSFSSGTSIESAEEEEIVETPTRTKHDHTFTIQMIPLKRVKIKCTVIDFDICFSENLLQILGLHNSQRFTLDNFNFRTKTKDTLLRIISLIKKWDHKTTYEKITKLLFKMKKTPHASLKHLYNFISVTFSISTLEPLHSALLWYDPPIADLFISDEDPSINKHEIWREKSVFWAKYISEEEYQKFYHESKELEQVNQGTNYSSNLDHLITISILKKIAEEQLLLKNYFSDTAANIIPYEIMFIYSDLIKPEPFNAVMSRLLAVIKTDGTPGKMSTFNPTTVQYKSLDKIDISTFKILIASDKGEPIPFIRGPAILTLHFIRN